jgi:hypothetical protein
MKRSTIKGASGSSAQDPLPKELKYTAVTSTETYKGKTYSEWIADWINWFFRADPEESSSGPVIFLKQYPRIIQPLLGRNPDQHVLELFKNDPNLMVGDDRIEIFSDQAILFPVVMAYWVSTDPSETEEYLRQRVRSDIDNGDNPPKLEQITINGREIRIRDPEIPGGFINAKPTDEVRREMRKYRVETSLFTTMVADVEYGLSYKDYVEYPMDAGTFNTVVCGYYFLITDLEEGRYIIHSHARGRSTEKGDYYAELLYDINVIDRKQKPLSPQPGRIPGRITQRLLSKVEDHFKRGSISEQDRDLYRLIILRSRDMQQRSITELRTTSSLA